MRNCYPAQSTKYMLTADSGVKAASTGAITVQEPHHRVRVEPGDVIGLSFSGPNPVPFDYSFFCDHHNRVIYRKRAQANVGSVHTFNEQNDASFSCRLYSVFVKIQPESMFL